MPNGLYNPLNNPGGVHLTVFDFTYFSPLHTIMSKKIQSSDRNGNFLLLRKQICIVREGLFKFDVSVFWPKNPTLEISMNLLFYKELYHLYPPWSRDTSPSEEQPQIKDVQGKATLYCKYQETCKNKNHCNFKHFEKVFVPKRKNTNL